MRVTRLKNHNCLEIFNWSILHTKTKSKHLEINQTIDCVPMLTLTTAISSSRTARTATHRRIWWRCRGGNGIRTTRYLNLFLRTRRRTIRLRGAARCCSAVSGWACKSLIVAFVEPVITWRTWIEGTAVTFHLGNLVLVQRILPTATTRASRSQCQGHLISIITQFCQLRTRRQGRATDFYQVSVAVAQWPLTSTSRTTGIHVEILSKKYKVKIKPKLFGNTRLRFPRSKRRLLVNKSILLTT